MVWFISCRFIIMLRTDAFKLDIVSHDTVLYSKVKWYWCIKRIIYKWVNKHQNKHKVTCCFCYFPIKMMLKCSISEYEIYLSSCIYSRQLGFIITRIIGYSGNDHGWIMFSILFSILSWKRVFRYAVLCSRFKLIWRAPIKKPSEN